MPPPKINKKPSEPRTDEPRIIAKDEISSQAHPRALKKEDFDETKAPKKSISKVASPEDSDEDE